VLQADELGLPAEQYRLDREGGKIPDDVVKLYPDFRRVRDIRNDEPREAGQHLDRLGYVPALRYREIKNDRKSVLLAQLNSQGIESLLPLRRKAAKNQYCLSGNGVDDLTDRLVVQQKTDELCYLDVIDCDVDLVSRCYDKVVLLRSL
jgi:hypothetical protein